MKIQVKSLNKYDEDTANRVRELLIQLSRSGKDRGEIPKEWFEDLINSPYHDMLVVYADDKDIIGIATLSIVMGPIVRKIAYLEDCCRFQLSRIWYWFRTLESNAKLGQGERLL